MDYIVIIPARYASSRLPGKPLIDIKGKSLLQRTYLQCLKAVPSEKLYVATDDQRIVDHCNQHGIQSVITSPECLTGTDRIAEVAKLIKVDYYINVQGDEPLINPADIKKVIDAVNQYPGEVINGFAPILNAEDYFSLSVPKVVCRPDGRLLYMSRSPIPGNKKSEFIKSWRQVCVYAFPRQSLFQYVELGKKTELEEMEDLEIIRFLELGYEVRMLPLSTDSIAVDTPSDVEKVIKVLNEQAK
jgi:3-deoxy-manno-octulosonate cytidylyltransferase (CMP-KDO synthetase)